MQSAQLKGSSFYTVTGNDKSIRFTDDTEHSADLGGTVDGLQRWRHAQNLHQDFEEALDDEQWPLTVVARQRDGGIARQGKDGPTDRSRTVQTADSPLGKS